LDLVSLDIFFYEDISLFSVNYAARSEGSINDAKYWFNVQMQDIYGASGYFLAENTVKKEKHL
jgi:hypothetical protein